MNTIFKYRNLITAILLYGSTCVAESSVMGAPELVEFNVNNLSYSFESKLPDLSKAYIELSPTDRKDGIEVGTLTIGPGGNKKIVGLAREIADNKHGKYDSLLISHKNKLVFESYYRKGRINLPHFQASVTKSYLSLAVGRAIQLGHLTMDDLNKPIIHFLKGMQPEKIADGAGDITLHQTMSMSSGIRLGADRLKSIMSDKSEAEKYNISQQFLQHSEAISPETRTFRYQDPDARITMQVLDSVVPGGAAGFLENELLDKIGIDVYGWKKDIRGLPIPESGSSMTSRDMLKLGSLVINKGKWHGEQLISEKYLATATSKITKPTEEWIPDSYSYGFFWYLTHMAVGDKSYKVKFAWGGGGQHLITIEDLDLIIVVTGHDSQDHIISQISKTILPAFVK